jgi:hypothetical protein
VQVETIGQRIDLDGKTYPIQRIKFDLPVPTLRAMVEAARVECHECGALGRPGRRMVKVTVYDSPFDEEATTIYVCRNPSSEYHGGYGGTIGECGSCFDLLFDTGWGDFRYFPCDRCNRIVIRQCPSNGWHSYTRITDDGEEICLRCYEEDVYANGLPRAKFADNQIPGMFYNRGDLGEHGFELVDEFDDYFVNSEDRARRLCEAAIRLIDAGHKVAIDYERLGIGGGEGYVSLYQKPPE